MALLEFCGFDDQISGVNPTFYGGRYSTSYASYTTETHSGTGRAFQSDYINSKSFTHYLKEEPGVDELIVGFAMKSTYGLGPIRDFIFSVCSPNFSSNQSAIYFFDNGRIGIYTRNTSETCHAITPGNVYNMGIWNYFEIKIGLGTTDGYCTVRVNGAIVLTVTDVDLIYQTGTNDTKINRFWNTFAYHAVDDFYVCDNTGSSCNDFLGAVFVETLTPSSNGNTNDGTPSTGTDDQDEWDCVNELEVAADDTDYITLDAINEIELYNVDNLSSTSYTKTIYGVKLTSAAKAINGFRGVNAILRTNSTNYVSSDSDKYLGANYETFCCYWMQNPDDSLAWEEADINAIESGIKITI
jgi:hypothetical protein